jgi:hypothetical protein
VKNTGRTMPRRASRLGVLGGLVVTDVPSGRLGRSGNCWRQNRRKRIPRFTEALLRRGFLCVFRGVSFGATAVARPAAVSSLAGRV